MKNISILVSIVGLLAIASCTPPPKAIIPPLVKQEESVVPNFKKIDGDIKNISNSNKKITDGVENQKNEITKQTLDINEALYNAEKIKQKLNSNKVIDKDSIDLVENIKKIQTRNLFLEKQITDISNISKQQGYDIVTLTNNYNESLNKLILKEAEADNLRKQASFLSEELTTRSKEIEKLKQQLSKEKEKHAKSSVYRNWIIAGVCLILLWFVFKNVITLYFPAIRR